MKRDPAHLLLVGGLLAACISALAPASPVNRGEADSVWIQESVYSNEGGVTDEWVNISQMDSIRFRQTPEGEVAEFILGARYWGSFEPELTPVIRKFVATRRLTR